jgi:hypothetical protein
MREGGQGANDTMELWGSRREWHSLKDSLIKVPLNLKDLKDIKTTTMVEARGSDNGNKEVVVLSWNLPKLLLHNRVDAKIRHRLTGGDTTAEIFVSWLLYAASRKGSGIGDPIGHAVSRILQDPDVGAGKDCEGLAELSPEELANLIHKELKGTARWGSNREWNRVMRDADRVRVETLAEQLGMVVFEGDNP